MNYYNEFDPHAAAWLNQLIHEGLIPNGHVDTRSIKEVSPADVAGYTQCHFFAGIGGWSYALDLAGWPRDRPVWTGSCPCQPFSPAGKGKAQSDDRHLWPVWFDRLISKCRPDVIFGEQVNAAIRHGWLDGICADLEGSDYAVGQVVFGAHSAGSPHIRQRLYWVAHAEHSGHRNSNDDAARVGQSKRSQPSSRLADTASPSGPQQRGEPGNGSRGIAGPHDTAEHSGPDSRLADTDGGESGNRGIQPCGEQRQQPQDGGISGMEYTEGDGREQGRTESGRGSVASGCGDNRLGHANDAGSQGRDGSELPERAGEQTPGPGSAWSDSYWHQCRDGKARRVPLESPILSVVDGLSTGVVGRGRASTFPLAEASQGRVMLLRGYGNAIVPQAAAAFINAFMETQ